jgi:hypothetical protein
MGGNEMKTVARPHRPGLALYAATEEKQQFNWNFY